MTPGETIAVHDAQLKQLRSDLEKHESRDDGVHGQMLGELGDVKTELATLNANLAAFRETFAPMVQAYFDDHPSKVQNMPALSTRTPSNPPAYKVDAKKLGLTIGGFFGAIEIWMQLHDALAKWIGHH